MMNTMVSWGRACLGNNALEFNWVEMCMWLKILSNEMLWMVRSGFWLRNREFSLRDRRRYNEFIGTYSVCSKKPSVANEIFSDRMVGSMLRGWGVQNETIRSNFSNNNREDRGKLWF